MATQTRAGWGGGVGPDWSPLCPQAYDNDEPDTNNSRLLFSLLPGPYSRNFSLDPDTGLLQNVGPLDREAIDPALEGRIVLTVRVSDCGKPSLSTEANVTITVEVRQPALTEPSSLDPCTSCTSYCAQHGRGEVENSAGEPSAILALKSERLGERPA